MIGSFILWWMVLLLRWGPASVRLDAVTDLGQPGNARAVGPLISALDRNPEIRHEIATALGKIGDPRASDALMALLLDKQAATRAAAVWALGTIGDARAADPLAAVLATDGVSGVCDAAADALIRLRDARGIVRGVPMLILRIRRSAQGSLPDYQSVGDLLLPVGAAAVEPLIELLQHGDSDVQELAIKTLVRLADARAVEPLIALLQDASPPIRRASAEALAKLGDARATEALVTALGDRDPEVRQTSANLLARSGPRAVEPLIGALSAEDPMLRRESARVLALLRDARAVEPLISATEDPVEEVRWAAANTLIAIGNQQAIEPLIRLLMRGDVVPTGFLQSLASALRRVIRNVPSETLRELALLESVLGPPTRMDMGHGLSRAIENRVDCPELRQIAQQELTRRGIED